MYILSRLRKELIKYKYRLLIHEYQGVRKILNKVFKVYYFLKIKKVIKDIIKNYNTYIWNKVIKYILYNELKIYITLL